MLTKPLAALALLLLVGCSPSAFRVHATAIVVVASAHTIAGGTLDAARDHALDEVEAAHPVVGDERTAALRLEAARWEPGALALDAVRGALLAWVQAVELAQLADDGGSLLPALLPMAARVLALWDAVAATLRAVGIDVPTLPPAVLGLVGGAS